MMTQVFNDYIRELLNQSKLIDQKRKLQLEELSQIILEQLKTNGKSQLTAICTHNSRRSQLTEAWFRVGAEYFSLNKIHSFSGGTEATAFNPRMVKAMIQKGFPLLMRKDGTNPQYFLDLNKDQELAQLMFSKKYDDEYNPECSFLAIMVCDHADQNCPVVFGADRRFQLMYKDPKEFDDTKIEEQAYLNKVDEIGREILCTLSIIAKVNSPFSSAKKENQTKGS